MTFDISWLNDRFVVTSPSWQGDSRGFDGFNLLESSLTTNSQLYDLYSVFFLFVGFLFNC